MLGTSGTTGERALLDSASARILPPWTFDSTDCKGSNMSWIWPPIRSVGGRAAFIGHVLDVDAGRRAEHLAVRWPGVPRR